ncbi:MAG: glycine cleavage system protein GcvH [Myxococcota bacterium]
MNIPNDLRYTSHDEWVRKEGTTYVIGITDFAQDQLGELVHFEPPEVGKTVAAEDVVCEVESVKAVAEIYAPLAGTITEVNETLADGPEAINGDPYGNWIYKIESADADYDALMDAEAYKAKIG